MTGFLVGIGKYHSNTKGCAFMDWVKLRWTGTFIGVFRHKAILSGMLEANKSILFERRIT